MKIFRNLCKLIKVSTLIKAPPRKMTYNEKISDTVHDGAEAVNDAAKSLYEKALDTVYDGAEAVNHAVKEQWGKISQETVLCAVASILFVYGLCKVVNYFDKQMNVEEARRSTRVSRAPERLEVTGRGKS